MVRRMTATEAKAKMLSLLDDVEAGDEVEITRHGRPVARLVAAAGARAVKGSMVGVAMTVAPERKLFCTGDAWETA